MQGGFIFEGQLPANTPIEAIKELTIRINGGVRAVFLFLKYERDFIEWNWTLIEHEGKRIWALTPQDNQPWQMQILERDYLNRKPYADFVANSFTSPSAGTQPKQSSPLGENQNLNSEEFPIQNNIFPYSQPVTTNYGKRVAALWVTDNPNNDELNRTEIQYSFLDGSTWSNPQYLSNDSLSDFRPQVQTDKNGNLFAVWERANQTLTRIETSTDLTKRMEIAWSRFDDSTAKWSTPQFIT